MIKLKAARETDFMGVAWMLGYDGTAIPVKIHIYGAIGVLDSNVEAAIWMLKYSPYDRLNSFLRSYVGYLANDEVPYTDDKDELIKALRTVLISLPYSLGKVVGWTKEQTADFLLGLVKNDSADDIYELGDNVDDHTGDFVCRDLNETFIRVRMNDEYNAASYNGVCYFRIGSTYKDWTNPIYMFVHKHKNIHTIVVERDAESDGNEASNTRNVMINNMSREKFLSATKLPFLGSRHTEGGIFASCYSIISKGNYTDLGRIKANASRIARVCDKLRAENIATNYKTIVAPWASRPNNR